MDVKNRRFSSRNDTIKDRNIIQRSSTLMYEMSKSLGNLSLAEENMSNEESQLRNSILKNNDMCEYCECRPHSTLDHFFPLVKHSFPTDACNDTWNLVPACKECNSSKGGKTIEEWSTGKGKCNPFADGKNKHILEKLTRYQEAANKYRYRKTFDTQQMHDAHDDCKRFLQNLNDRVHDIKLSTVYRKGV
jgi:hypothetical protein